MKKTGYITFGAVMSALCVVVMLVSYFPYLTYTVPAFAALFVMAVLIEIGIKWAIFTYISAAIISLLIAEPESAMFFAFFFGYYPIVKVFLERIKNKALRIASKILVFNASLLLMYFVIMRLMGIESDFGGYSQYIVYVALVLANVVFFVYDIALKRLSGWYLFKMHPIVKKFLKK